jgi:hypothetical protein
LSALRRLQSVDVGTMHQILTSRLTRRFPNRCKCGGVFETEFAANFQPAGADAALQ